MQCVSKQKTLNHTGYFIILTESEITSKWCVHPKDWYQFFWAIDLSDTKGERTEKVHRAEVDTCAFQFAMVDMSRFSQTLLKGTLLGRPYVCLLAHKRQTKWEKEAASNQLQSRTFQVARNFRCSPEQRKCNKSGSVSHVRLRLLLWRPWVKLEGDDKWKIGKEMIHSRLASFETKCKLSQEFRYLGLLFFIDFISSTVQELGSALKWTTMPECYSPLCHMGLR